MKRGRNQRRRQGGNNPNRALDSNGPDVRIRGTANQIYDKYQTLARDASSAGDRVKAENYLQHAEHYFRMIRAMQPAQQPQTQQQGDGDQPAVDEEGENKQRPPRRDSRRPHRDNAGGDEEAKPAQPEAEEKIAAEPEVAEEAKASEGEAPEEAPKPRRRRTRKATKKSVDETPAAAE